MANTKQTSPRIAGMAARQLRKKSTPRKTKEIDASAVAQSRGKHKWKGK